MDDQQIFEAKYGEQQSRILKPTILVCGYCGSGKTSLIQAICGKHTVPDDRIGHGEPMTQAFLPYRNDFINLWDSKGFEAGEKAAAYLKNLRGLVRLLQQDKDVHRHIHLVWYTILGPGARVTPADIELIKSVFDNVIVVLTKSDLLEPEQRQRMTEVLLKAKVDGSRILSVSRKDAESLRALVRLNSEALPAAFRDAFQCGQQVDLMQKKAKAQVVIHSAALAASAVAAANPLPVADAALITPIQFGMIAGLAIVYGIPAEAAKTAAAPIVAQVVGVMTATSLGKIVPGWGGFIQAAIAFGLTEAIGLLVDRYLTSCFEARMRGEPMPPFVLPGAELAEYLRKAPAQAPIQG